MIQFTAILKKLGQQGEKTGWTIIDLPAELASTLMPNNKRSFRVKGQLDKHKISGVATIPMGGGDFIIAVNAEMRKAIRKSQGDSVEVKLALDKQEVAVSADLLECLQDEPVALKNFNSLPGSHQNYFTRWIESAKTETTKAKRIAQAIAGLSLGRNFGEAMRTIKKRKEELG